MVTKRTAKLLFNKSIGRKRQRRFSGGIASLTLACGILASQSAGGRETPRGGLVDGNAIVRRMMTTYRSAQAFEETSEAKIKGIGQADYIQSTTIRFKRPNLFYLSSEDPVVGTYQGFCNGKTVIVYSGAKNTYTQRNSPVNLPQTMTRLYSAGKSLMENLSIIQMLSPIGFLSAKGMPDECKNFRFVRMDVVDGNKVAVVTGQADSNWLQSQDVPKQTVFDRRDVTFWVDTHTYLLRKASCDLRWHSNQGAALKQSAGASSAGFQFVETHHGSRVNLPLRDEDFFFNAPKGAVEQYQQNK